MISLQPGPILIISISKNYHDLRHHIFVFLKLSLVCCVHRRKISINNNYHDLRHHVFLNSALCTAYIEGNKKKAWPMFACRQRITWKPNRSFPVCSDHMIDQTLTLIPIVPWVPSLPSFRSPVWVFVVFDGSTLGLTLLVFSSRGTTATWACSATRRRQVRACLLTQSRPAPYAFACTVNYSNLMIILIKLLIHADFL
jgi:hypothetical protein